MVIFPMSGVLSPRRRLYEPEAPRVSALDVLKYASGENPCAALLIEKIPHL